MAEEGRDLPLLSLDSNFQVVHYVIRFHFELEKRIVKGIVVAFLKPLKISSDNFAILDLNGLKIKSVGRIRVELQELDRFMQNWDALQCPKSCVEWLSRKPSDGLAFTIEEWCIRIPINNYTSNCAVCIEYETTPEGQSLQWIEEDGGCLSVITAASLVNNRALLPYQDAPNFMATWQLVIQLEGNFTILSSGDTCGVSLSQNETYFYTSMLLPLSTFAVAIGKWECCEIELDNTAEEPERNQVVCHHLEYPCRHEKEKGPIPCQLYHMKSVQVSAMVNYIIQAFKVIEEVLGRILVNKLEFVVVAKSITYLGFTSPGLIFISPSVLYGESPMLARIAHEMSHSWFGIHIGPKDWAEEWISEGFATYMEDVVELKMTSRSSTWQRQLLQIKSANRFEILKSDCENVESNLQCAANEERHCKTVKDGLHLDKIVSQIPYLKGYFFLADVSEAVGLDNMLVSLKNFVLRYHGCLISSDECVDYLCQQFPDKRSQVARSSHQWLYNSSICTPVILNDLHLNPLYQQTSEHYEFWRRNISRRKGRYQCPLQFSDRLAMADQLVHLLDLILRLDDRITKSAMEAIINHYRPQLINADAYHRVCELIVANHYARDLPLVEQFLINHSSMGAYMYGELVLTGRETFCAVARRVFQLFQSVWDSSFRSVVSDLVCG